MQIIVSKCFLLEKLLDHIDLFSMTGALEPSSNRIDTVGPPEFATEESFRGPYKAIFPRGNGDRNHNWYVENQPDKPNRIL